MLRDLAVAAGIGQFAAIQTVASMDIELRAFGCGKLARSSKPSLLLRANPLLVADASPKRASGQSTGVAKPNGTQFSWLQDL
jgi:hypothetical protein